MAEIISKTFPNDKKGRAELVEEFCKLIASRGQLQCHLADNAWHITYFGQLRPVPVVVDDGPKVA